MASSAPVAAGLTFCLVAAACAGHRPAPAADEPPPLLQLGSEVRPLRYALDLEVDPARDAGIRGRAEIEVELTRPRRTVWLHGLDLRVSEVTVTVGDAAPERAAYEQVNAEGLARLRTARPVGPGRATVRIAWEAPWGRVTGAYRSRAGAHVYAATHFEAAEARRAFPCFDDPGFKTPFDVTLRAPEGAVVAANAPEVESGADGPGRTRVRFATTPPLPTYLVFVAVGPFDVSTPPPIPPNEVRADPLPVRVLVPRGRTAHAGLFAETGAWAVPALERYFGIAFPYPKLDHVVLPDHAAGAMENAGAISYLEALALLDPSAASMADRRMAVNTIVHELAHQWFGDLVTLRWWDDIWLNESFATWMTTRMVEAGAPALREDLERLRETERVMGRDALASARAIRQPVERVSALDDQFDPISYFKGAAVLHAFERFAGPERFRDGIRGYLAARAHGTGTSAELLEALSRASGTNLAGPLRTFLDAPGVPLVEAGLACGPEGARVSLRQSRFLPLGAQAPAERTWSVPVCLRLGFADGVRERCVLLRERTLTVPLPEGCPDWIFPDAGASGYYRWALAPGDLARLRARGVARLSEAKRIAYARGLSAAARSGAAQWGAAMEPLAALAEDAPEVALVGVEVLQAAHDWLVPEPAHAALERFALARYGPLLRNLGLRAVPGDDPTTRRLRGAVVELLARAGRDPALRRELGRIGRDHLGADGGPLRPEAADPDVAPAALAVAIEEGGEAVLELAIRRALESEDGAIRDRLLTAVASADAPALGERVLALTRDERLRHSEARYLLALHARAPWNAGRVLAALERDPDGVLSVFTPPMDGRAPLVFAGHCDAREAERVRAVFEARRERLPHASRLLAQALEAIRLCAAHRAAHAEEAARWLEARAGLAARGGAGAGTSR